MKDVRAGLADDGQARHADDVTAGPSVGGYPAVAISAPPNAPATSGALGTSRPRRARVTNVSARGHAPSGGADASTRSGADRAADRAAAAPPCRAAHRPGQREPGARRDTLAVPPGSPLQPSGSRAHRARRRTPRVGPATARARCRRGKCASDFCRRDAPPRPLRALFVRAPDSARLRSASSAASARPRTRTGRLRPCTPSFSRRLDMAGQGQAACRSTSHQQLRRNSRGQASNTPGPHRTPRSQGPDYVHADEGFLDTRQDFASDDLRPGTLRRSHAWWADANRRLCEDRADAADVARPGRSQGTCERHTAECHPAERRCGMRS